MSKPVISPVETHILVNKAFGYWSEIKIAELLSELSDTSTIPGVEFLIREVTTLII